LARLHFGDEIGEIGGIGDGWSGVEHNWRRSLC
jgi:hypothetical protein